jgi:hypothetical protein
MHAYLVVSLGDLVPEGLELLWVMADDLCGYDCGIIWRLLVRISIASSWTFITDMSHSIAVGIV